jgi:tetratricopeptide (TPR) repeat protein
MKNFHSADFWRSEILAGLAKVSSCQQKYDDALDYLKQLETLITAKYGEKSMERCAVYKELAKCEENMNEYETAIDYLIQAHKMTRHTHKEESVEMGEVSAQLGELYAKTKMSERESFVETYFQQAVSSYRLACGEHDVRTLECRQRWVNALKTIGTTLN